MKKKFRYMMSGMFTGTDGNRYDIEIPSPIIYENKKDTDKAFNIATENSPTSIGGGMNRSAAATFMLEFAF